MRGPSSTSAGATYLNRPARLEELRGAVQRARERVPEIVRVRLFGSLVSGIPTPRSDADLLIEVSSSAHARPRDRIPDMLTALSPLPCPVDLFVLTSTEVEAARASDSPLLHEILSNGVDLA